MRFAHLSNTTRRGPRLIGALTVVVVLAASATIAVGAVWDPTDPALSPPLAASPASGAISGDQPHYYQHHTVQAGDYLTLDLGSPTEFYPIDMALYSGMTNDPFAEVAISATSGPDEYISWLIPPSGEGTYTIEIKTTPGTPAGTWALDWDDEPVLAPRLWGKDRYETSYAISRSTFATATTAVIASGADFPDALTAAGLAGAVDAPVLLTKSASVPAGLTRELVRLGVTKIYVVGGKAAVSEDVFTQLQAVGDITQWERLSGRDRYETAKRVAEEVWRETGAPGEVETAFVVRGDEFADALAVSPFAYHEGAPVLLTKTGVLSGYTSSFLSNYKAQNIYVAGGESAVSADVFASLESIAEDDAYRWYGSTRFSTAAEVASQGVLAGFSEGWANTGIATGVSFPDALSGGASCGMYGGPLLLTRGTTLSAPCAAAVDAHGGEISRLLIFGGESAISQDVVDDVAALIP